MADPIPSARGNSTPAPSPSSTRVRPWLWPILLTVSLVAAILALFFFRGSSPTEVALKGELVIGIMRAGVAGSREVGHEGAVPVRAGDRMHMQISYNQPAFSYLLWLDTEGKLHALYPWNDDQLEVLDANLPPPTTRPATILFSPTTISNGWNFGKRGGLETVLLLARRAPLGTVQLGTLIGPGPRFPMRRRDEVAILALDRGNPSVTSLLAQNRGPEEEASASDRPVREIMTRLADHFELIRAVRFAHEGE